MIFLFKQYIHTTKDKTRKMNMVKLKPLIYSPHCKDPIIIPTLPITVNPKFIKLEAAPTFDFCIDNNVFDTIGLR